MKRSLLFLARLFGRNLAAWNYPDFTFELMLFYLNISSVSVIGSGGPVEFPLITVCWSCLLIWIRSLIGSTYLFVGIKRFQRMFRERTPLQLGEYPRQLSGKHDPRHAISPAGEGGEGGWVHREPFVFVALRINWNLLLIDTGLRVTKLSANRHASLV